MGIYEFNLLTDEEKRSVLEHDGIELGRRAEGGIEYIFFRVDSFFVEVVGRVQLVPEQIRSFNSTAR